MFPTNTVGLVLFVVLLAPGFLAGVARSRATPTTGQTALREIATVVFLSLVAWCFVGLIAAGFRWLKPSLTPNAGALVRDSTQEWQKHHVALTWWAIGLVVAACLMGFGLGRLTCAEPAKFVGRWLTPGSTSQQSGWYLALAPGAEYFADPAAQNSSTEARTGGPTIVRCVLDDGTIVAGDVFSFSPATPESGDRDLILAAPIFVQQAAASDFDDAIETGLLIVSNRHIKYFTVQNFTEPRHTLTD